MTAGELAVVLAAVLYLLPIYLLLVTGLKSFGRSI